MIKTNLQSAHRIQLTMPNKWQKSVCRRMPRRYQQKCSKTSKVELGCRCTYATDHYNLPSHITSPTTDGVAHRAPIHADNIGRRGSPQRSILSYYVTMLHTHHHAPFSIPKELHKAGHIKAYGWWACEWHDPPNRIDANSTTVQPDRHSHTPKTLVGELQRYLHDLSSLCRKSSASNDRQTPTAPSYPQHVRLILTKVQT